MTPELLREIGAGAVIVTATPRLAREVRSRHDEAMEAAGRPVWERARALSWDAWVRSLWEDAWSGLSAVPTPVSDALWEEVLERDAAKNGRDFLDVPATARMAADANRLLLLYGMPLSGAHGETDEETAFRRWRSDYGRELARRGWIDGDSLPRAVAEAAREGRTALPGRVAFYGFDEFLPVHRRLFEEVERRGGTVFFPSVPACEAKVRLAGFPSPEAEVRAAAAWAKRLLAGNPALSICVAAVDMEAYAITAERIFAEALTPSAFLPGAGEWSPPVDLSLGRELAGEPVAAAALALIGTLGGGAEVWDWRALLLSPFWDAGVGETDRALFAERLLDLGHLRLDIEGVAGAAEFLARKGWAPAAALRERLARLALRGERGKGFPPSEWARLFRSLLDAAGWARGAGLGSREYQAAEKFREALSSLGGFDGVKARAAFPWALSRLKLLCAAPFRPEGEDVPVRVMGVLEASGIAFDRLWVLGAGEASLPSEARPHPFLSVESQRAFGVRQASAEGQLAHAEKVLARLLSSAPEIVVSYPAVRDENPSGPSPLLAHLPPWEEEAGPLPTLGAEIRGRAAATLERIPDPPVPLAQDEEARGGSALFADQAKCPFLAFVRHRLSVQPREEPPEGVSAAEQGTGLHEALCALHERFPTRASLLGANPEELAGALDKAVEAGIRRVGRKLGPALEKAEKSRMRQILAAWTEAEKARPEFEVAEREAVRQILVGGLPTSLRIDRLDRLENGGALVIDYKSGRTPQNLSKLYEERLTQPQLPLYALACPEAVGVCYAELDRGACALKGVADEDAAAEGLKKTPDAVGDWKELRDLWRRRLEALAGEFLAGRADVDPVKDACSRCGGDPLCRRDREPGEEAE